jgi:hypothetical protein
MSTRTKVLLTIALAVLCSWLFGCGQEHLVPVRATANANGVVDAAYMQSLYEVYNVGYFGKKLPQVLVIDMLETNPKWMASTMKMSDGSFIIHFNETSVVAARTGQLTMLHEMCHVKTWGEDVTLDGEPIDHGRYWRSCMIQLDMQGAFRQVLIDNYFEAVH